MRRVAVLGDYNARLGVSEGELRVTQSRLLFYAAISLLQEEGALPLPPLPPSLSPPQGAITAALNALIHLLDRLARSTSSIRWFRISISPDGEKVLTSPK